MIKNNPTSFGNTMEWIDLFCGGGGATTGAFSVPGVRVVAALNHSKNAIKTHSVNHPETKHYKADIRAFDEHKLPTDLYGIWMSSECTNFTKAKGGEKLNLGSRTLPNELFRFAEHTRAKVIIVENVREFLDWGPIGEDGRPIKERKGEDYKVWVDTLRSLGYTNYEYRVLDAADFGAYTSRKRYFGIFTRDLPIAWPEQTHSKNGLGFEKWKACREKMDLCNLGKSIFNRKKPLALNTLRRIAAGLRRYAGIDVTAEYLLAEFYRRQESGRNPSLQKMSVSSRFFAKQYNSENRPETQLQDIDSPIGTITSGNHFSLIQFFTKCYSSNGKPDGNIQTLDVPIGTITTRDCYALTQFFQKTYNSNGHPEYNIQSLEEPVSTITGAPHLQVISLSDDFDIFARYLTPEEAKRLQGFPDDYVLTGNVRDQMLLVGNSVVPLMAQLLIEKNKHFCTNEPALVFA